MAEKAYEPSLPYGLVKRLMKSAAPDFNIGKDAIEEMERTLAQVIKTYTPKAADFAKNAKRKTIFGQDVILACKD